MLTPRINNVKKRLNLLPKKISDNIVCLLLYGSILSEEKKPNDLDCILIVRNVKENVREILEILRTLNEKLDFNIYTKNEIKNKISYYTREFKLEYLSKSLCIYGQNILRKEFETVSEYEYKRSILIRSIKHLNITRQIYYSDKHNENEKCAILKKYFFRISRDILLYLQVVKHRQSSILTEKISC